MRIYYDLSFDDQRCKDILTDIVENDCSGYWGRVHDIKRDNSEMQYIVSFKIDEMEDEDTGIKHYSINLNSVRHGIKKMFSCKDAPQYALSAILSDDIDCTVADIILQYATIGEIKYG